MRTKALLFAAVLASAGVASSLAQVYSVNAVGYVNVTLKPGFQLVANPLNNTAANGNTVSNLLAGAVDGTTVYKFDNASGAYVGNSLDFGEWANPNMTLNPGEGAFIMIPAGADLPVTFVGDVKQGTLTTPIAKGFSIVASQVPQAGLLQTDLGYVPEEGDTIYTFNVTTQQYVGAAFEFGEWSAQPNLKIGEAIFVASPSVKSWVRTFTVN